MYSTWMSLRGAGSILAVRDTDNRLAGEKRERERNERERERERERVCVRDRDKERQTDRYTDR